jgi:hypothetical protein
MERIEGKKMSREKDLTRLTRSLKWMMMKSWVSDVFVNASIIVSVVVNECLLFLAKIYATSLVFLGFHSLMLYLLRETKGNNSQETANTLELKESKMNNSR